MLSGARGEGPADLALQGSLHPQAASLIEEAGDLRRDAAKPRSAADDDGVIVGQLIDRGDRSGLMQLKVIGARYHLGNGLWDALHVDPKIRTVGSWQAVQSSVARARNGASCARASSL